MSVIFNYALENILYFKPLNTHRKTMLPLLGDMVIQGTFLTPTGMFLVSMTIMYMMTAILHPEEFGNVILLISPCHVLSCYVMSGYVTLCNVMSCYSPGMIIYGLIYFICIPSGYLLLIIYSLVNMHIVSWGTRESNK